MKYIIRKCDIIINEKQGKQPTRVLRNIQNVFTITVDIRFANPLQVQIERSKEFQ